MDRATVTTFLLDSIKNDAKQLYDFVNSEKLLKHLKSLSLEELERMIFLQVNEGKPPREFARQILLEHIDHAVPTTRERALEVVLSELQVNFISTYGDSKEIERLLRAGIWLARKDLGREEQTARLFELLSWKFDPSVHRVGSKYNDVMKNYIKQSQVEDKCQDEQILDSVVECRERKKAVDLAEQETVKSSKEPQCKCTTCTNFKETDLLKLCKFNALPMTAEVEEDSSSRPTLFVANRAERDALPLEKKLENVVFVVDDRDDPNSSMYRCAGYVWIGDEWIQIIEHLGHRLDPCPIPKCSWWNKLISRLCGGLTQ